MANVNQDKTLLMWGRVIKKLSPTLYVASTWNGLSTADPDNLTGGVSFRAAPTIRDAYVLTAKGNGDAGGFLNTGAGAPGDAFIFAGDIAQSMPTTYIRGWPSAFGIPDNLDPTTALGSAVGHITGNEVQFPTTPGAVTTTAAYSQGRFYVEMKVTNQDLFSTGLGIGVMRPGFDLTYIFANAEYNASDVNGGAMLDAGNEGTTPVYQLTGSANGVNQSFGVTPDATHADDTYISLAIAMLPYVNFQPALFGAVPLPRLICCPLSRRRALLANAR